MKRYANDGCHCDSSCQEFTDGSFYSIFFGLNDKCTGAQSMPAAQALAFVQEVCAYHFVNGYTILEGSGADRGSPNKIEASIYIMAINTDESTVFQVADIFQKHFNQSEVLIEQNKTQYLYYDQH
ncbi:DUF3574 domain-containing protein [Pseudoflavonifractor phocaeensis]|uniref:DUF3574 domain-containing protein n=1 Tax=Pseudoflavonifractor phocaeensis TaxID=1870988 RepID=UPI0025A4B6AE|nr:DUF3574 domain-containing protein [Pseudoflavonifractor phocaeensis]MDM8238754.1 DUF3574 domain-containing protein [Pseudoflavonifractor phocaeensis]